MSRLSETCGVSRAPVASLRYLCRVSAVSSVSSAPEILVELVGRRDGVLVVIDDAVGVATEEPVERALDVVDLIDHVGAASA